MKTKGRLETGSKVVLERKQHNSFTYASDVWGKKKTTNFVQPYYHSTEEPFLEL